MRKKPQPAPADPNLSRRERQIMDVLFARGRATGPQIQEGLPDQPHYSSVRTILRVLERKGYVRHAIEGMRYVYEPTVQRQAASRSALERIIRTFFDGSAKRAVAALLDPAVFHLSKKELDELAQMIEQAQKEKK
ncbi:MAG TPA: BlaI/MecI/CopY family transcriptional regulator [Bryobacteraceae bacterium]|nr:BlaI/MecI/CopY family transcriptional regulator [Bryobacteraceae bacterium]